jgi:hypothetical protein
MERFYQSGQVSKDDDLRLNLLNWARKILFYCMNAHLVFGPYLFSFPKHFLPPAKPDNGGKITILRKVFRSFQPMRVF